ncbi:hypothetical protein BZA70DRAFT_11986 [Myxozyma melibiosi]|uniref:Zn(2)-C6 fungal-type domain-containing protein n=1 Tax=Myxozyma melibiosi TaxID=54550 RepID=A0ABR1FEA6_9ASCO
MSTHEVGRENHRVRAVSLRACLACRERKIKCDGAQDCHNCRALSIPCVFVPSHRGGKRKRRGTVESQNNNPYRSADAESLSRSASPTSHPTAPAQTWTNGPSARQSEGDSHQRTALETQALQQSLPVSTTASQDTSQSLDSQSLTEALTSIQSTLASLQQQINEIRGVSSRQSQQNANRQQPSRDFFNSHEPYSDHSVARPYPRKINSISTSLRGSDSAFSAVDLPGVPVIMFLIDAYYNCYHPGHSFMVPKSFLLDTVEFEHDAALLHAMFSVSCRFISKEYPNQASLLSIIQQYQTDPMYWVSRAEKWLPAVENPVSKLQTALLLAISAIYDDHQSRANQMLTFASSISETYRLDLIDSEVDAQGRFIELREEWSNPNCPNMHTISQLFPTELEKESCRRLHFMMWELRLLVSTIWYSPRTLPEFPSRVCPPCCEVTYEDHMRDWNGDTFLYEEFEQCVFSDIGPFVIDSASRLGVIKTRWRFNSSCFRLAAGRILAETVSRMQNLTPEFVEDTEHRVRELLYKIYDYRTGPTRIHMSLFSTNMVLYSILIILHRSRARERLVFVVHEGIHGRGKVYEENPIARVHAAASNAEAMKSFEVMLDAATSICEMVNVLIECKGGGREDVAFLSMSPFVAYSLGLCLPVIASKIVLDGIQLPSIGQILGKIDRTGLTDGAEISLSDAAEITGGIGTQRVRENVRINREEQALARNDLDLYLRCIRKLGDIWSVFRTDYEECAGLVQQIEKYLAA